MKIIVSWIKNLRYGNRPWILDHRNRPAVKNKPLWKGEIPMAEYSFFTAEIFPLFVESSSGVQNVQGRTLTKRVSMAHSVPVKQN